jgi:hypothetical protein
LVVYAPDPQHTTVTAWLNGVIVLLPSAIARGEGAVEGEDFQFATELVLAAENTLVVRLTGKPGTQIAFWVEGEVTTTDAGAPVPRVVFETTPAVAATADLELDAKCADLTPRAKVIDGERVTIPFVPADWNRVMEATADELAALETVLDGGTAWIWWDGVFNYTETGPFGTTSTYYFAISSDGNFVSLNPGSVEESTGPDVWLLSITTTQLSEPQRVLCMSLDP